MISIIVKSSITIIVNFPGKVLLKSSIGVFDMINSYLSRCKALWSLTAFEVKVLSFVTIW